MEGRTILVIAHRLSTVRNAHEILVMMKISFSSAICWTGHICSNPGDAERADGGEGDALRVDRPGRGLQEAGQAADGGRRRAVVGF